MSLEKPHTFYISTGPSPYEVSKALLSGRYKTEQLSRHWTTNMEGFCHLPECRKLNVLEDVEHVLLRCMSLSVSHSRFVIFTMKYDEKIQLLGDVLLSLTLPNSLHLMQFMLDCSVIPKVIQLVQQHGASVHKHFIKVSRTWCYLQNRERPKILGISSP